MSKDLDMRMRCLEGMLHDRDEAVSRLAGKIGGLEFEITIMRGELVAIHEKNHLLKMMLVCMGIVFSAVGSWVVMR